LISNSGVKYKMDRFKFVWLKIIYTMGMWN
jgi:hypothetical protein